MLLLFQLVIASCLTDAWNVCDKSF